MTDPAEGKVKAGWYAVGNEQAVEADYDPVHWFRHWRYVGAFSLFTTEDRRTRPFLTFDQMMAAAACGRYWLEMRAAPGRLRPPEEIAGDHPPNDGPRGRILSGLTWDEAAVLCRLAGGRLASEAEVEIVVGQKSEWVVDGEASMDTPAGWTADAWSEWNGRLIGRGRFDPKQNEGWFVAPDRWLPDCDCLAAEGADRERAVVRAVRTGVVEHRAQATTPASLAAAWIVRDA